MAFQTLKRVNEFKHTLAKELLFVSGGSSGTHEISNELKEWLIY
jgi:hypothetical protein